MYRIGSNIVIMNEVPNSKNINVMIAGRSYPLRIKSEDEIAIRGVVEEINEKIKEFQLTYKNRDKQDCLSMALLTYAVESHKKTFSDPEVEKEISDKIIGLNTYLDSVLG